MAISNFNLFRVLISNNDPDASTSLSVYLQNLNEYPDVEIRKNGNPFKILGDIEISQRFYSGVFCLRQMTEIPPILNEEDDEINEIDVNEDEGLGHFTSFFYDNSNGLIGIQRNANGPSANNIASYFIRRFGFNGLEFRPVINPNVIEDILTMNKITTLEFSISAINKLPNNNQPRAISEVMNIADFTNAMTLNLEISIGRSRNETLNKRNIRSFINNLRRSNNFEVRQLKIKGKENEEDNLAIYDLINNKQYISVVYIPDRNINDEFVRRILNEAILVYRSKLTEINSYY